MKTKRSYYAIKEVLIAYKRCCFSCTYKYNFIIKAIIKVTYMQVFLYILLTDEDCKVNTLHSIWMNDIMRCL